MYPILGRYGPFFLYGYSVAMGLGVVVSLGVMAWEEQKVRRPHWLDGALLVFWAAVMGGRAGFVWGEWSYYQERPSQIMDIWQGGFSYHGALLTGLLALWLWCWLGKRPFYLYATLFAPALALLHVFGWLACYLEGCGYGLEVVLAGAVWVRWLTADLPDSLGVFGLRYQTQLLGMLLSLLIFGIVRWGNGRWSPPRLFWFTLLLLSLMHTLLYFGRGDVANIDLTLNVTFALLSLLLLQYSKRTNRFES